MSADESAFTRLAVPLPVVTGGRGPGGGPE
jgi:hypothetical protein